MERACPHLEMRLDRFITLHVARPLLRWRRPTEARLPILMYHSISNDLENGRSGYYKVCTAPARFAEQMNWLAENGYEGVTLGTGLARLNSPQPGNGRKPVAITFDDGFRDFYTEAFPILQGHHFQATMYLPTAFIADEPQSFQSRDCMTWSEVSDLHSAGIEFGSHTVTHPKLVEGDWPQIEAELRDSKSAIEQRLRGSVTAFAYPYAFPQAQKDFVPRFQQTLKQAGYESCTTTEVGRVNAGDNLLSLKRLPINDADDAPFLRAKLEGAYDWLAIPQASAKAARQIVKRRAIRSFQKHAEISVSV